MKVRVETQLPISPALAWETVQKPETLQFITRGVLGFRPTGEIPATLEQGMTLEVRLLFFHVLPAWRHEIHVVRLDHRARQIQTEEHGGPVRGWMHLIEINPLADPGRCRYSDEIEIHAGPLTPLVWLYAQLFYRYRQRRWQKLARSVAPATQSAAGST